jgi:hypothetical protein
MAKEKIASITTRIALNAREKRVPNTMTETAAKKKNRTTNSLPSSCRSLYFLAFLK